MKKQLLDQYFLSPEPSSLLPGRAGKGSSPPACVQPVRKTQINNRCSGLAQLRMRMAQDAQQRDQTRDITLQKPQRMEGMTWAQKTVRDQSEAI